MSILDTRASSRGQRDLWILSHRSGDGPILGPNVAQPRCRRLRISGLFRSAEWIEGATGEGEGDFLDGIALPLLVEVEAASLAPGSRRPFAPQKANDVHGESLQLVA